MFNNKVISERIARYYCEKSVFHDAVLGKFITFAATEQKTNRNIKPKSS